MSCPQTRREDTASPALVVGCADVSPVGSVGAQLEGGLLPRWPRTPPPGTWGRGLSWLQVPDGLPGDKDWSWAAALKASFILWLYFQRRPPRARHVPQTNSGLGGRLPFPFPNPASRIAAPYTRAPGRRSLLPVLGAPVQMPPAEGRAPVCTRAQGRVPAAPWEGDHFLLFRSQGPTMCLSFRLRAPLQTVGSPSPSVPSVQLAPWELLAALATWPQFVFVFPGP